MLCSSLHVKLHYNGYPGENKDIQFWTRFFLLQCFNFKGKKLN
jgi:hypothetical protein